MSEQQTMSYRLTGGRHWEGRIADPTVTRNADGSETLNWPDDSPDVALISKQLLAQMIDERNATRSRTA